MQSLEIVPQLPPSPPVPIPSSSNSSDSMIYPSVKEAYIPKVKQEFATLKDAEKFYNSYARQAGFSTRANSSRKSKNGEITRKEFVCYKEGRTRLRGDQSVKRRRGVTREGCPAKLAVVKKGEGFQVSLFVEGHTHGMISPGRVHLLPSHRKATAAQKSLAQLGEANVPPCQQMSILELQCEGIENAGFTQTDLYNAARDRRKSIGGHDADMFYEYLQSEQEKNPAFIYTCETDDENRLTHCFWADATCRKDYKYFGDVVVFDTTSSNTNKYGMVLAPILGVNHHGQTTVFGCALLSNKTTESFEWFFTQWLQAMPAGPPKMIITDQGAAMAKAIDRTLPHTTHRLCMWDIMNKFSEKIGELAWLQYSEEFKNCIGDSETPHEFEARWVGLLDKATLSDNQWLKDMYEIRESWIPAYSKHIFSAHMSSSQRVESQHAFFKRFMSKENSLLDFATRFDWALTHIRNNEKKLDYKDKNEKPNLKTSWRMEKNMSEVYTRSLFYKFQDQLFQVLAYVATKTDENEKFSLWKVEREENPGSRSRQVSVDKASNYVSCSCKMFEYDGIPCRHMLAYFNVAQVKQLPDCHILPRWTVSAKAGRVMDDLGVARGKEIGDGSMLERRRRLFQKFSEVVDVAILTEEGTRFLEQVLEACKIKVFTNPTPREEGALSVSKFQSLLEDKKIECKDGSASRT